MKKLIVLCVLLSSCGFFKTNSQIDEETTAAPPVVQSEKDPTKVLYNPHVEEGEEIIEDDSGTETCDYEEIILVEPRTVRKAALAGVWYTKKDTFVQSYDFEEFIRSEHMHIKGATLKSVSGENLNFVRWMKSNIANTPAVWSDDVYDPNSPRISELNFNGAYDFATALRPKDDTVFVEFEGEARGKSPKKETELELHLLLASFYNCR